ncbi:MAG: DJ-1/PfpI family protein [Patescibacteria group bacterium]
MHKNALFIIAPENFRDEELFVPREILEKAGVTTTVASREPGICRGNRGGSAEAVIGLNQVNAEDFDVVIFVGGGGSQIFRADPAAHLIAQKTLAAGKILAAICAAPTILAQAGVLQNKNATVFPDPDYEKALIENGANLTKSELEIDGDIITANNADVAKDFGEAIIKKLVR